MTWFKFHVFDTQEGSTASAESILDCYSPWVWHHHGSVVMIWWWTSLVSNHNLVQDAPQHLPSLHNVLFSWLKYFLKKQHPVSLREVTSEGAHGWPPDCCDPTVWLPGFVIGDSGVLLSQAQSGPWTLSRPLGANYWVPIVCVSVCARVCAVCVCAVCVFVWVCARVSKGVFGGLLGAGDSSLSPVGLLSKCLCYDSWAAFIQTKSLLSAVHLLA